MTSCSARDIAIISCCAITFLALASMVTLGSAAAAIPAAAPLRAAQDRQVGPCAVAFMAKTATILKSSFAERSGLLPQDPNQPESMLLADAESVRGVLSLPEDFSEIAKSGAEHISYYLEFTLKSDSIKSRFHEYIQQKNSGYPNYKQTKEENGAIHYVVEALKGPNGGDDLPRVPGYQVVFDGKRITFASECFEYDPKNLPPLTNTAKKLLQKFSRTDGFLVLDLQSAKRLIESGLDASKKEMPPLVPYLEMLERIHWAAVSLEMNDSAVLTLQTECAQTRDANDLTQMLEDLVVMAKENNRGMGPSVELYSKILDTVIVKSRGIEVEASIKITEDAAKTSRLAAGVAMLTNNQKQAALSFHNFFAAYGDLPFHAREGQSEELSWRVRVLPFLDQMELYNRFDLSQSWDSAKNLGIMETTPMPRIFGGIEVKEGETQTNLCWVKSNVKSLADIKHGTSNTICFVHSDKYVNWTENNDVTPADVMAQFQALKPGEYIIASFYDGSVRRISAETDPEDFARMLDPGMDK